jgi:hypothetical protein
LELVKRPANQQAERPAHPRSALVAIVGHCFAVGRIARSELGEALAKAHRAAPFARSLS